MVIPERNAPARFALAFIAVTHLRMKRPKADAAGRLTSAAHVVLAEESALAEPHRLKPLLS